MLRRLLWRMNKAGGGPRKLASLTPDQLEAVFNLEAIAQEWQAWAPKLSEVCQIADGRTGGVNVGGRRAVFYLSRAFAPPPVLSIRTHVGASSGHLRSSHIVWTRDSSLVTVGLEDLHASPPA